MLKRGNEFLGLIPNRSKMTKRRKAMTIPRGIIVPSIMQETRPLRKRTDRRSLAAAEIRLIRRHSVVEGVGVGLKIRTARERIKRKETAWLSLIDGPMRMSERNGLVKFDRWP